MSTWAKGKLQYCSGSSCNRIPNLVSHGDWQEYIKSLSASPGVVEFWLIFVLLCFLGGNMSPVTGWGFTRTSPAFSEKKVCTQSSECAGLFLSKKANFQRPDRLKKKELKPSCSLSQQLWSWYRKKPHQPKLRQLKTVPPYLSVVCAVSRGWFSNLPTCGCGSKAELQGGWAPTSFV